MYQIYSYVKNEDKKNTGKVSGMLLYAKTTEEITPNVECIIGGNRFAVKTFDLNQDFGHMKTDFIKIVEEYIDN